MKHQLLTASALALLLLFGPAGSAKATAQAASSDSLADSHFLAAELTPQVHFARTVPAGDYSGVANLGDGRFAVVSDKSRRDGFFVFRVAIDSLSGAITQVTSEGLRGTVEENRDAEGIAFLPERGTVAIVGEADSQVREYDLQGQPTGRTLQLSKGTGNHGYESLTYNARTGRLWTCTEGMLAQDETLAKADSALADGSLLIRLQSFDADFQPQGTYAYLTDRPLKNASDLRNYAFGVSELLALDDGSLLVLEREFAVPHNKLGATVVCKIYRVKPEPPSIFPVEGSFEAQTLPHGGSQRGLPSAQTLPHRGSWRGLPKTLVAQWTSRLTLLGRSLANYEGMCLGPTLADGSQTVVLVADSQSQAGGVLRDWWRTLVLRKAE